MREMKNGGGNGKESQVGMIIKMNRTYHGIWKARKSPRVLISELSR